MKRLLFCTVLLALFCASSAEAALTYGGTYYRQHKPYALGNDYNVDPLYLFMTEVDTKLTAVTLANGATIDNAVDNVIEFNENSEEIKLTFSENALAWSSTSGVVLWDFGVIVPKSDQILFDPVADAVGTVEGTVYYDSDTDKLYVRNASAWVDLTAGASGVTDLDTAYNGGATMDVDGDAVTLTVSDTDNNRVLDLVQNDTTNNPIALQITNTGSGDTLQFVSTGGKDIDGSGSTWSVTSAGAITAVSADLSGALSADGTITMGNGTGTFEVASSGIDISTAGAISNVTTLGMSGNLTISAGTITLANGQALRGSTTTAQTIAIQAYDNDTGPAYVNTILITNGNTPALALGSNNETVAIDSSDWDISTTGAMTGIGAITMDGALSVQNATVTLYTNEAVTIGHAANGAADDLTISQTGNQDASLIITSAGNGTDALTLSTTANSGDIVISSHDKIDMDSTGTFALNAAGDTLLIQVDSDGAGDDLSLVVDGDDDSSIILDSDGTGADAIKINASNAAGGLDIDAGTNGIAVDATGGAIAIGSTKDAAAAIGLTTNGGNTETIYLHNTQGNTAAAVNIYAQAGGITLNAASGGVVFTTGQTRKVLYDVNDVKTDVTNPPTRGEVGTAGQWMADALKFDADGGATGDDLVFISWVVPDGYKADTAKLNVYWSFSTAEDAADECVFDATVNSVAEGEALDAAGTALDAVTTVVSDASADNGKLFKDQINIEVEDIAVGDLVTIMFWVDEDASAMAASGTCDIHYFEIEYESTE